LLVAYIAVLMLLHGHTNVNFTMRRFCIQGERCKALGSGEKRQKIDGVNGRSSCCESNVDGCVGSVWKSMLWSCPTPAGMLWHVTVTPLPHGFHSSISRRCLSK